MKGKHICLTSQFLPKSKQDNYTAFMPRAKNGPKQPLTMHTIQKVMLGTLSELW